MTREMAVHPPPVCKAYARRLGYQRSVAASYRNVTADAAVVLDPLAEMPFVTFELVQVQALSKMMLTCPSTKFAGGVMMLMAVPPETWNSGPGATIVAAEATIALTP